MAEEITGLKKEEIEAGGGWVTGPRSCCLTGAEPGGPAEAGGSELETSQRGLGQKASPGKDRLGGGS